METCAADFCGIAKHRSEEPRRNDKGTKEGSYSLTFSVYVVRIWTSRSLLSSGFDGWNFAAS
jgi:hypothetical protein